MSYYQQLGLNVKTIVEGLSHWYLLPRFSYRFAMYESKEIPPSSVYGRLTLRKRLGMKQSAWNGKCSTLSTIDCLFVYPLESSSVDDCQAGETF